MNENTGMSPDPSAPTPLSAAEYLAAELERLMALPLTTPAEVERWTDDCGTVQETLAQRFPHFVFAHDVMHFFHDADIRARDDEYRDYQHRLMSEHIHRLRTSAARA